ncbi:hypothetical protein RJ640_015896 [Escallonia rubra]|uniref:Uncharacterized protein n=1 Tax=Escallonia rubra TaxID=112253 RepID=A0AA88UAG9_9ASTE|nr:hypothetical protein RJ640_015896 [Escallonia rubra]
MRPAHYYYEKSPAPFLCGERSREHRRRRTGGTAWRGAAASSSRFRLLENARMDQVNATMENDVLTASMPKEERKKPENFISNRWIGPKNIAGSGDNPWVLGVPCPNCNSISMADIALEVNESHWKDEHITLAEDLTYKAILRV